MEKQLKCVLLLSLKEMVLRRVVVLLWSSSDIVALISKVLFFCSSSTCAINETEWRETLEYKIKDKVLELDLPQTLMKQMFDIVEPIGIEIRRWKMRLEKYFYSSSVEIGLPDSAKLCFTTAGKIDTRKTAKELLRCDKLDVVERYKIACFFCLEDDISLLWEELPEKKKELYSNVANLSPELPFCWPHILKKEPSKLDDLFLRINPASGRKLSTLNQYAFEFSAEHFNKTATEYFFQKLTYKEREASLMPTAHALVSYTTSWQFLNLPKESLSDVFLYLLSLMTPEQQIEIFRAQPINVLLCFFDWPWQVLFLENAGLLWTFLPQSEYGKLLEKMARIFECSYRYFLKPFQEFFVQSPLNFKKCFVGAEPVRGNNLACCCLYICFEFEDSECIEVIFRSVDVGDRLKLVLNVLGLFYRNIIMDKWRMVEVCLREATLSKEDRERLKEAFISRFQIEWRNSKVKRFLEFFDETNASAEKVKKDQKCELENCCQE